MYEILINNYKQQEAKKQEKEKDWNKFMYEHDITNPGYTPDLTKEESEEYKAIFKLYYDEAEKLRKIEKDIDRERVKYNDDNNTFIRSTSDFIEFFEEV